MRRRQRQGPSINMVPYIDILLVLVLIFMCGAANWVDALSVDLPVAGKHQQAKTQNKVIEITKSGRILVAKKDCGQVHALKANTLAAYLNHKDDITVMADKSLPYKDVMHILVLLQKSGYTKASLAYQPS